MDDKRNYFPIVITAVIWSGYYVATKFSNAFGLSPFVVGIAIRFVAFILLTALMLKNGEFHKLFKVEGILWKLILIGCFGFLLDITAFLGFKTDAAVYGIVLLKCDVLFVNVLSV
ncbi:MAG: EamA/RhaT family transporter, partial [Clostridia bacterium]|nr:EamA/RhaT family transporter [Clostridia bacterium]